MKISTPSDASIIVNSAVNSHSDLWSSIKKTEEFLIDYRRPIDPNELKEKGLEWKNNWNYGKGRTLIEQGVSNNVTDIFRSIVLIETELNKFDKEKHKEPIFEFLENDRLRRKLSQAISFCFGEILENDTRTHTFLREIEYNSFTWGFSPILRTKQNYFGSPIPIRNIAFEDRTRIDNIGDFVVFDVLKSQDLLYIYDNGKISNTAEIEGRTVSVFSNGWIKEGIEDIIIGSLKDNQEVNSLHKSLKEFSPFKSKGENGDVDISSWEDISLLLKSKGSTWLCHNVNNIFIARIFTKERDKSIVETIIRLQDNPSERANFSTNTYDMFLYQKKYNDASINNFLNIIFEFGINETGFIHSIRGVSKQIAEESLRYDFKRNCIEDKLLVNGSLLITTPDSLSSEAVKLQTFGPYTILPEGVVMVPNQIKQDLAEHISSIRLDDLEFKERTQHYFPRIKLSNRPNKDEVQLQGQQYNYTKSSKNTYKLIDYSSLFTTIIKDLISLDFDEKIDNEKQSLFFSHILCELDEYEIEKDDLIKLLKEIKCVKLNAVNDDIESLRLAADMARSSEAKLRITKQILLALGFSREEIKSFIEGADSGTQIERAALENAAFYNTSEVVFDVSQDHVSDLDLHFAKIDRILKGVQGGEDPIRNFNYMTNALSNTEKHVSALKQSYFHKNKFPQYFQLQAYFVEKANELAGIIKKLKEQQQDGQQQSGELTKKIQLKEFELMKKIERTNIQSRATAERKLAEFKFKMKMKQEDHEAEKKYKEELAKLEVELKQLQSASKLIQ